MAQQNWRIVALVTLHWEGPRTFWWIIFSWLHHLSIPFLITEKKRLKEPAIVSDGEDEEGAFLADCDTLAFFVLTSTPYLSATSICLRPQIWHRTHWALPAYINSSSKTNNLLTLQAKYSEQYVYKFLNEDLNNIIRDVNPRDNPDKQCHIALPQKMFEQTVKWFHQVIGAPLREIVEWNIATALSSLEAQVCYLQIQVWALSITQTVW